MNENVFTVQFLLLMLPHIFSFSNESTETVQTLMHYQLVLWFCGSVAL